MQTNLDKVLGPTYVYRLCIGKLNSLGVIKTSLLSIQGVHPFHLPLPSLILSFWGSCTDEQQRRHKLNEAWLHADFQPEEQWDSAYAALPTLK